MDTGSEIWRERLREWFLQPPYAGAMCAVAFAGGICAAFVLAASIKPQVPQPRVSAEPGLPPPIAAPAPQAAPVPQNRPEDEAAVEIRAVPKKVVQAPKPITLHLPEPESSSEMPNGSIVAQTPEPSVSTLEPGTVINPGRPAVPGTSTPDPEVLTPAQPREVKPKPVEVAIPEPAPAPAPKPVRPRRPVIASAPVPRRPSGRLKVYFDADSSTFAKHHERMPLQVEVFVDGRRRLRSADPEKREFDLGPLPEGPHDVQIVPHVGDAEPDAYREVVNIEPGEENRFKAVLHHSHGVARIARFKEKR